MSSYVQQFHRKSIGSSPPLPLDSFSLISRSPLPTEIILEKTKLGRLIDVVVDPINS
jgi:hypothetical protein